MDVDNDNFYDEISSFIPSPGEYNLDDLDEIIRSTDASLDFNVFPHHNDFAMDESSVNGNDGQQQFSKSLGMSFEDQLQQHQRQQQQLQTNGFNLDFTAFPSPATSHLSSSGSDYNNSPYETPARTSSTSSVDGDNFNPDDFINFLNENIKPDDQLDICNQRNTPSPAGSCGSSTSGVHSDISSVSSMPQKTGFAIKNELEHSDLSEFIKFKTGNEDTQSASTSNENATVLISSPQENVSPLNASPASAVVGAPINSPIVQLSLPILPASSFQPVQPVSIVQGTIIPVQTVPLSTVTPVVNVKAAAPLSADKKPAKSVIVPKPVKLVSQPPAASSSQPSNAAASTGKPATAPTNSKPKTIYLSSNDFKALMQKMNNTNSGGTDAKKPSFPNGQMPKIIMKTASGKYITANKLPAGVAQSSENKSAAAVPLNVPPKSAHNLNNKFVGKPQHANVSKAIPSHSRPTAAMVAAARATLSNSKGYRSDFNLLKGLSDEKLIKKQLRMLKNRESASLSRKKKKEYIERLENRISILEKENYSLKGENSSLRSQLMAFAKTCNCKHRNVSDFILSTLSMNETRHSVASSVLSDIDESLFMDDDDDSSDQSECSYNERKTPISFASARNHVRIAPKPLNDGPSFNKGFKHHMSASTVKKNIAILFVMAFIVTMNVGNFHSYLSKSELENALEASAANAANEAESGATGTGTSRRLLWVANEHEFHEQNNRTKREADLINMPPPPLHFLRPVNRTTADKLNGTAAKDEPPNGKAIPTSTNYGPRTYGNATNYVQENNMRLARNLHKWIGGNDYLNLTGLDNDIGMAQYKLRGGAAEFAHYDIEGAKIGLKHKRKLFFNSDDTDETGGKHKKMDVKAGDHNSLDLFKPSINEEYLKLFKGIKRQDDTFYVLSFNLDHILLPASAYNKSARPKMSLMLPAGDPSVNGDVVLMQIDCEVINTTELVLESHMIPEKLRRPKYGPSNVRVKPTDVANNETKSNPNGAVKTGPAMHLKREEDSKYKPAAPRTYFMVGPKNNTTMAAKGPVVGENTIIKKKPTIIKLNANDSVIGSGVMNVRNSSLFTRMRDTVVNTSSAGGLVAAAASDVRKLI